MVMVVVVVVMVPVVEEREMETAVIVIIKDFKFVPLMFVPLGFGPQIPLMRAIFHGLGIQTQGYKP